MTQNEKALARFKADLVGGLVRSVRPKTMLRLLEGNKAFIREGFGSGLSGAEIAVKLVDSHRAQMDRNEAEQRAA